MTTEIVMMPGSSGSEGTVSWDLPEVRVALPDERDIVADVLVNVGRGLKRELTGHEQRGFAKWLLGNLKVTDTEITYPDTKAVRRVFGRSLRIKPAWIREVVAKHVQGMILTRGQPARRRYFR